MELEELKAKWESMKDLPGWKPKPKSGGIAWLERKILELEVAEVKEEVKEEAKEEVEPIEVPKPKQTDGFDFNGENYPFKNKKGFHAIISLKNNSVMYFSLSSIESIISGKYFPFEIPEGQVYPKLDMSKCKTCR